MKSPSSHNKSIAAKRIKESDVGTDSVLEQLDLIIFNSYIIERIKKAAGKKWPQVLAVYSRYYQVALMQKTNQPRATLRYMMRGTLMGRDAIRNARKILKELELIEDIQAVDNKQQPIKGKYYVLVHHYIGSGSRMTDLLKSRGSGKSRGDRPPKIQGPEIPEVNAYINTKVLKGKAYKQKRGVGVKRNSPHGYKIPLLLSDPRNPKNKRYRSLALKMMKVVIRDSKYTTIKPNEKEWTTAIRIFCERDSKDIKLGLKTIRTIIKYHDDPGKYYLTPIHQPKDLKGADKLQKIGEFMQRVDEGPRKNNGSNNDRVVIKSGFDHTKTTYTKI